MLHQHKNRIIRSVLPSLLLVTCVVQGALAISEKTPEQPNMVLLFVDDLGWADLGHRQPDIFETPHISKLAEDGLDFKQAYIASPCCSPSRATLVTGQHPARLKMVRHTADKPKVAVQIQDEKGRDSHHLWLKDPAQFPSANWLDLERTTYAEALKELGYYNLFLGKWHIGHDEHHPKHQGFDKQIGTTNQGHPSSYYPDYFKTSDEFQDEQELYLTDKLTFEAVNFIQKYDGEQPFMLSLWYYNVHKPTSGRRDLVEHFKSKGLDDLMANYAAQVKSVDESVGKIRSALAAAGIEKNTIVILLSDQGGYYGNPPFRGSKTSDTLYEGGARVPFIIYWPDVTVPASANNSIVQSTDLFPTLVEIAGGQPDQYENLDGVSLFTTIKENSVLDRQEPIYGYRAYEDLYVSVREGDWKLLAYRSGLTKLYNIASDPGETRNLAKVNPEIAQELTEKLKSWEVKMGVDQYSGVQ